MRFPWSSAEQTSTSAPCGEGGVGAVGAGGGGAPHGGAGEGGAAEGSAVGEAEEEDGAEDGADFVVFCVSPSTLGVHSIII